MFYKKPNLYIRHKMRIDLYKYVDVLFEYENSALIHLQQELKTLNTKFYNIHND